MDSVFVNFIQGVPFTSVDDPWTATRNETYIILFTTMHIRSRTNTFPL